MRPKEKAKDLCDDIEGILGYSLPMADEPYLMKTKEIALMNILQILVNELIQNVYDTDYWLFVKSEIEKIKT